MTIIESLIQLRDDLMAWVRTNMIRKVDKEDGKGLSTNDFTTEEKESLANAVTNLDTHTSNTSNPHGVTISQLGVTATVAELNHMSGITSGVQSQLDGKADTSHTHAVSDVTNLQAALDAKADDGHTHTITASASDDDVVVLTGADGSNKVTYSASHATSGVSAGTYRSVTVNEYGHVTAGTNPTTLAGYGITDAARGSHTHEMSDIEDLQATLEGLHTHSHDVATQSTSGFMGSTDKAKLDGIAEGATRVIVDDEVGSSTTTAASTRLVTDMMDSFSTSIDTLTTNINNKPGINMTGVSYTDANLGTLTCGTNAEAFNTHNSNVTLNSDGMPESGNLAVGNYSCAKGNQTIARGEYANSRGYYTQAHGNYSDAGGYYSVASGELSYANGTRCVASGSHSYASGFIVEALDYQHAIGHYNDTSKATASVSLGTSTGTAFVIGNGTSTTKSNAFRVTGMGQVMGKSAYSANGADYAELFEWADQNLDNEDRVGYFVTFDDGRYIRKAKEGDYILGIVSGNPCVLGNHDECWLGQYEMDEWGRFVYEDIEEVDEETGETKKYSFYKVNPNYDKDREYTHRQDRAEWDAIGLMGVLSVRDDGTCEVNGYCKCTDEGIATAAERGLDTYRVIERVNENIVKVVLK